MTLDQIRKLCEAATPGPWFANDSSVATDPTSQAQGPPSPAVIANLDDAEYVQNRNALPDARFIAAARTLLPKLLAVAEAAAQIPKSPSPVHRHILTPGFGDLAAALAALEAEP